ncbi:ABC transporter substrate-binding protein [Rhodococcus triatomae]|uniref:Putative aliphatic sulfonates-binding protein n=1 Tax=Rhodococcus triatomae TaxID=300028 RepID=A0A1G8EV09_9NOCA|nr:ABC transporter substrate-binding protein [Rhodococcus triatomae]QNG19302.1 ABC transporter substrate-binding protein [Rhodococcus triatomae]QNG24785.1 ABC transporter substrate-binding protein [Rhodococcus triatomae]SDH73736.1 sulfonate transport system substrate-binding protein [Rhodococcus triatomae]
MNLRSLRFRSAGVALIAAASLVLASCGDDSASADPEPTGPVDLSQVTLAVGDQRAISIEVLLTASGQLDDLPYDIEFSTFTAGPPLVEAASAGGIDLAQVGNTPAIFGAAAKANIKIVGALEASGKGDAILVGQDSTIDTVNDLRDKKIAVTKGSSAHANLLLQLKKAGLGLDDVDPVYVAPADGYSALTRGEVDAWAVWDPFTAIAEQEVGARSIATADEAANGYNFWIASDNALADAGKSAAIEDFLTRYAAATQWSSDNIDEWSTRYAELTSISEDASRTTWTRSIKEPIPLSDDVIASEQEIADAFTESNEIPGTVDFAEAVDTRFE